MGTEDAAPDTGTEEAAAPDAAADIAPGVASLVRCDDGADTDDNWTDFELVSAPSPGILNSLYGCGNLIPVDCEVSDWSDWGDCSEPCAGGTQTRTRTVVLAAKNGGAACPELEDTQACNEDPCPAACCVQGACQLLTPNACQNANGTWSGATSCSPDPCAASAPCSDVIDLGPIEFYDESNVTNAGQSDKVSFPAGTCANAGVAAGAGAGDLVYKFSILQDYAQYYILYLDCNCTGFNETITATLVGDCADPVGTCISGPTDTFSNGLFIEFYNVLPPIQPGTDYYLIIDGIHPGDEQTFNMYLMPF